MRVVVFGAGGILGQHMRRCVPPDVEAVYTRLHGGPDGDVALDLTHDYDRAAFLSQYQPHVIVNLAGEGRTDVVEADPQTFHRINTIVPSLLAQWCHRHGAYLVQASSQGVFSGASPPYERNSLRAPVNTYGWQKKHAEDNVGAFCEGYCIARLTFVLGMRPHLREGRPNPFEHMLLDDTQQQVDDRWFSVSFARDAAHVLWQIACERGWTRVENIGHGGTRWSRFDLARTVAAAAGIHPRIEPVHHDDAYPNLAPRPLDTHYDGSALHVRSFDENLHEAIDDWRRVLRDGLVDAKGGYAGP